ncbi:MAG: hypothetical protein V4502_07980 [Pseudomonadota bacterium]
MLRVSLVILAALALTGCKPPKFDLLIVCPAFEASGVAVYQYSDPNSYLVVHPDHSWVKVDRTECVITTVANVRVEPSVLPTGTKDTDRPTADKKL